MDKKKRLKMDLILIALLLAVTGVLYFTLGRTGEKGVWAVVRVDGRETARYPLDRDGVYTLNGGTNVLAVENGKAWMESADCPDHICMKMGKIGRTHQVITCLPNLLTVTIEGGEDDGLDFIVG